MHSSLFLPTICLLCSAAHAGEHQAPLAAEGSGMPRTSSSAAVHNYTIPSNPTELPRHSSGIDLDDLFSDLADVPIEVNPWTRDPECLRDSETDEEYCVYTSSKFAGGRGVSFFVSPSIASKIVALPAFQAPLELPSTGTNSTDLPYEIRHVNGRGNGLFATRELKRGDLILADTPIGIYQSDAFLADSDFEYGNLRKTYEWLPEGTKVEFERLKRYNVGDMVLERINTNAFEGEFEGVNCYMLYPKSALMNHDCRPNAMYDHNPKTLVHTTYASRTIQPGEEITITYINLLQPHSDRTTTLSQIYGFTCTCSLCSARSIPRQASEARVSQILSLQSLLTTDWTPDSPATPEKAEKLLALYEKEHLHAAKGTGHMLAALAYSAYEEEEMAREHAEKAIEAGILGGGDREREEGEMRELVRLGKKHWSWGRRKGRGGIFG